MADVTGKFQYLAAGGAVTQEGACRAQFNQQTFTLTPDSGAPIVCDLGDVDTVAASDYEIRLPIYTGNVIVLRQLGKAYETLSHDLLEAHRQRTLECLLLEDLQEVARFNGSFELTSAGAAPRAGAAELRLFQSNLAVLPEASQAFQWRLADVDSMTFDKDNYAVELRSGQDVLKASKLAKRTEEFSAKLKEAIGALATRSAQALHSAFPFLNPDELQATAKLLREGHAASVARLAAIDPKFPGALAANAVDHDLKPYYDDLQARTANDALYAGFKLIRAGESESADEAQGVSASLPDGDSARLQMLYWFYFPLGGNIVAWEASSRGGRATYFFRLAETTLEAGLRKLDRVLGMVNFRRRPIYLSDDELEGDPKFHRYAIAARRIPELRAVRGAFVGRAIHSSLEAWKEQVKGIMDKAVAS